MSLVWLGTYLLMCIGNSHTSPMSPDTITRIHEVIHELCPNADICSEGNKMNGEMNSLQQPDFHSCCKDCSCGPDCEKNGDCCFPESLRNNSRFSYYNESSTCMFPMSIQPEGSERIFYQSYYMVTSSPESSKDGRKVVYNTLCGHESVAPWGNMYPVYSAKEKRLYKNKVCAAENGVTDGEVLDAVLACTKQGYYENKFMVWTDSLSVPDGCIVNFIYRGRKEDISHLKCYTDLIDTCPGVDFKLTLFETELQKSDVNELCTSGFISPFKSTDMYANIFCHICNEGYISGTQVCEESDGTILRAPDDRTFLGLIDGIFLTEFYDEKKSEIPSPPMICDTAKSEECRVVFCPSGQLRTPTGNCAHTTKIWYNQDFAVYLSLELDVAVNVYDVFKITAGRQLENLPNLQSPWPKTWDITKICFKEGADNGQNVKEFQVVINNKLPVVSPIHLLNTVRIYTSKSWTLNTGSESLVLKSRFLPYTDEIKVLSWPYFSILFAKFRILMNTFRITKLFLCDQVQLDPPEFSLSESLEELYHNITKRRFYNGEFTLVSSNSFDGLRARICVEDFKPKESRATTSLMARGFLEIAAMLLYFINK